MDLLWSRVWWVMVYVCLAEQSMVYVSLAEQCTVSVSNAEQLMHYVCQFS